MHRIEGQQTSALAVRISYLSPRQLRGPVAMLRIAGLLSLILLIVPRPRAAGPQEPQSSVSVTGLIRSSADLDGGGDFHANSLRASAALGGRLTPRITASAGVNYAYENWRFGTPGAFGPVAAWNEV